MLNKKILLSVLMIGTIAVVAGAGTWAAFSDTQTSTGNTFTAAKLEIALANAITFTGVAPNDALVETDSINIANAPDGIGVSDILLKFATTGSEPTVDTAAETEAEKGVGDVSDYSSHIIISSITLGGTDISSKFDAGSDGILTLNELVTSTAVSTGVPLAAGSNADLVIGYTTDDFGNEYQGDQLALDVTFTATQ